MERKLLLSILILSLAFYAGCISSDNGQQMQEEGCTTLAECYAYELGYECDTMSGEHGDFLGVVFSDGSICDAWEFYWGRCGKEWQTEYLKDNIEIQTIRDWPNDITVSGYLKSVALAAAEKGYYITEKDTHLDTLEVRDHYGNLVKEIRVFIDESWKEALTDALAACG